MEKNCISDFEFGIEFIPQQESGLWTKEGDNWEGVGTRDKNESLQNNFQFSWWEGDTYLHHSSTVEVVELPVN